MNEEKIVSLKGQFLIAMPSLADPNFSKTVTCICEHVTTGAVGVIINRPHPSLTGQDIFQELNISYNHTVGNLPIYIGGPVHMGEVFILHSHPFHWEGCMQITPTLALSNTKDILEAIAIEQGPESFLIILGCSGWGHGQLDTEISNNFWITLPIYDEIIYKTDVDKKWEEAMQRVGINPLLLSDLAGHA